MYFTKKISFFNDWAVFYSIYVTFSWSIYQLMNMWTHCIYLLFELSFNKHGGTNNSFISWFSFWINFQRWDGWVIWKICFLWGISILSSIKWYVFIFPQTYSSTFSPQSLLAFIIYWYLGGSRSSWDDVKPHCGYLHFPDG